MVESLQVLDAPGLFDRAFIEFLRSVVTQTASGAVLWTQRETSGSVAVAYNTALATGRDVVINGTFASDTIWTKGANWAIAAGVATHSAGATENLTQASILQTGRSYSVVFTVTGRTAGTITAKCGTQAGTARSTNNTFTETIVANGADLVFTPTTDFDGSLDNVTAQQLNILASASYPGLELLTDGDMEAATTAAWTAEANTTLSKQTTSPHGGSRVLRVQRNGGNPGANQNILTIGKRYHVQGYARSDGTMLPVVGDNLVNYWLGTNSTSWQRFDVEAVVTNGVLRLRATGGSGTEYVEYDDVLVTEVNPLNGTYTGVTLAQPFGALGVAPLYDGANDYTNIHCNTLNSFLNPSAGTLLAFAQVSAAGVWTDSTQRNLITLRVDATNFIRLNRTTTNNQLEFTYSAGGTASSVTNTSLAGKTTIFMLALTWSTSADQVKAFINGAQAGTTQTGLGTWVGNLVSTTTTIGAASTVPASVWSGLDAHVLLAREAYTPAKILEIAKRAGVV